jgi:hypothetical protein
LFTCIKKAWIKPEIRETNILLEAVDTALPGYKELLYIFLGPKRTCAFMRYVLRKAKEERRGGSNVK